MTDEELAKKWVEKEYDELRYEKCERKDFIFTFYELKEMGKQAFLAGLKADRPQWHKVADGDLPKGDDGFGKNGIHRGIYLKDRYGSLYTGNYFPKDDTHKEDCFAVEFLEWGFQGAQFCAKKQISEWCEIPTFNKE